MTIFRNSHFIEVRKRIYIYIYIHIKKQSFSNYSNANQYILILEHSISLDNFGFFGIFGTVTHFRPFDLGIVWFFWDLPYKITVLGSMSLYRQREKGRYGMRSILSLSVPVSVSLSLSLYLSLSLFLSLSPSLSLYNYVYTHT